MWDMVSIICTQINRLRLFPIDLGDAFWVDQSGSPPDDALGDLPGLMPTEIARLTETSVVA
jgi:hypothetical protein